jgi:hypothetical protein
MVSSGGIGIRAVAKRGTDMAREGSGARGAVGLGGLLLLIALGLGMPWAEPAGSGAEGHGWVLTPGRDVDSDRLA